MSGWIKMGTGLGSHPKVKTLRRALKADRLRVIGGLWAVWCVFDEHSAGGRLDGYTLDDMDEEIGWRGFAAAMQDIGWLIDDGDGLEAPDYEEHNGPSAKRRALDSSRKGRSRAKGSAEEPDEDPPPERTPVRTKTGHVSASDADNLRNREEKRREEEKEKTPHTPQGVAEPAGFARFWSTWPSGDRKGGKAKCLELWRRAKLEQDADAIVAHVEAMKGTAKWREDGGAYVPAPQTYLNGRRWDGAELNGHGADELFAGAL